MDAIKRYNELTGAGTVLDSSLFTSTVGGQGDSTTNMDDNEDEVYLPKIQFIVATKSAQAGINSLWLKYGKKKDLHVSPYEQVQKFGRVDKQMNTAPGSTLVEMVLAGGRSLLLLSVIFLAVL